MVNVNIKLRRQAVCAMAAAVMCVLSPWSIPLTVPVTLGSFAVMLCAQILTTTESIVSVAVYLLIGGVGVPVFAGFCGGFSILISPTGGYLMGYIILAAITSLFAKIRCNKKSVEYTLRILGGIVGTVVLYSFGTAWFCFSTGTGVVSAIAVCVLPFIGIDIIKTVSAAIIGGITHERTAKLR